MSQALKKQIPIKRFFAMPSMHTFKISPIRDLLKIYVGDGKNWIDPFAGENSPAEFTNDLNQNKPTKYHLHAVDFCKQMNGKYNGVLLDPPYSLTQLKQLYESIDVKMFKDDAQRFPHNVKELIAPKILIGGFAITFGWNSQGFGKRLGFKMKEILIINHGRGHNDTIVTVEIKIGQKTLFD